jgi:hypothetical protein
MSSVVDSQAEDPRARVAGAAAFAVGGAAALALAVLVWVLGYVGSLPFGIAPGADPPQGSNLYLPLAFAWVAAALAALVSAAISRRSPMAAVFLALAALAVGFAAPLLLTPAGHGAPPVVVGLLAWLVPAAALLLGLVAVAPHARSRSKS